MEGESPYYLDWTSHIDEKSAPTFKSTCERCTRTDELCKAKGIIFFKLTLFWFSELVLIRSLFCMNGQFWKEQEGKGKHCPSKGHRQQELATSHVEAVAKKSTNLAPLVDSRKDTSDAPL